MFLFYHFDRKRQKKTRKKKAKMKIKIWMRKKDPNVRKSMKIRNTWKNVYAWNLFTKRKKVPVMIANRVWLMKKVVSHQVVMQIWNSAIEERWLPKRVLLVGKGWVHIILHRRKTNIYRRVDAQYLSIVNDLKMNKMINLVKCPTY